MRAFMSTGNEPLRLGDPTRDGLHAEREARAILRETEPRGDYPPDTSFVRVADLAYWQRVCARKPQARPLWRDQNAAALALAETLAAFVGEGE